MTTGRINQVTRVETPMSAENFGQQKLNFKGRKSRDKSLFNFELNFNNFDFQKKVRQPTTLPVRQLTNLG